MIATAVAFWAFFALIQGEGMHGSAHGVQADCEEARVEVSKADGILSVSDACVEIRMSPVKSET